MKKNGFAIMELLVVIVIISALTAVVISNFPKIRLQLSLLRQVNKFEQDIRLVQEMSLAGVPYKDSSGTERQIDGYGIFVDINGLGNKKYTIFADKSPGNKAYDASDYLIGTVDFSNLEPGIKIKELNNVSSNKASVSFSSSKIETTINQLNPNQNSVEYIFSLESDSSKTKKVLVNTSGLIEVK